MKNSLTILGFAFITLLANKAVAQSNYSDFNTPPVAVTIVPAPNSSIKTVFDSDLPPSSFAADFLAGLIVHIPTSTFGFIPATQPQPVVLPPDPGGLFRVPPTFQLVPVASESLSPYILPAPRTGPQMLVR